MDKNGKVTVTVTMEGNAEYLARIIKLLSALDAYTPGAKGLYIGTYANPDDYMAGEVNTIEGDMPKVENKTINETPMPFTGDLIVAERNCFTLYTGDKNAMHMLPM